MKHEYSNFKYSIFCFFATNHDGMPHFLGTIPQESLSDRYRKRLRADAQFADITRVAVDFEFAAIFNAQYIDYFLHDTLHSVRAKSFAFFTANGTLNLVFQQAINGAGSLELFEAPFQNYLAHIAQLALLTCGEFLKLCSQSLANPDTDLCFPLTH
jgi:hypothetical protein